MAFRMNILLAFITIWILMQCRVYSRALEKAEKPTKLGFAWSNCGPATDPIRLNSLSITPDPIGIPGNIVISASVNVSKAFPADLNANLNLQVSIFDQWVHVPCENNTGSCNYTLCSNKISHYLDSFGNNITVKPCPAIPTADYTVSNLVENINKTIPMKILDGAQLSIDLNSNSAGHIGCFSVAFNITT